MVGAGHGGIEAIVLGALGLINFVVLLGLKNGRFQGIMAAIPADQLPVLAQQIEGMFGIPAWLALFGALERVFALLLHLAGFRRDLRLEDNAGLHYALTAARRVHCAFVFDREILDRLQRRRDRRVAFIHASLAALAGSLRSRGGALVVLHDRAREAIPALAARLGVDAVFANEDYEPEAVARDAAVERALAACGRRLHLAKDQAVFAKDEILTRSGAPFVVFTPYRNAWLARVDDFYLKAYPVERHAAALAPPPFAVGLPDLAAAPFDARARITSISR